MVCRQAHHRSYKAWLRGTIDILNLIDILKHWLGMAKSLEEDEMAMASSCLTFSCSIDHHTSLKLSCSISCPYEQQPTPVPLWTVLLTLKPQTRTHIRSSTATSHSGLHTIVG